MRPALEALDAQIETLFALDGEGRLRAIKDASGREAPRAFLGRTREGFRLRFRVDVPGALAREIEALTAGLEPASDLEPEPPVGAAIRRALERHAPLRAEFRGPAFAFPEREHADAGDAVRVTAANSDLLEALPEWRADLDEVDPCFAVVRDGRAVSICASARTARRAAEAGVETLPEWRGKGFATTATAAWAREIRRRGLEPLYSTTWDNRASRGVARRLGLVLYAEDWHWT